LLTDQSDLSDLNDFVDGVGAPTYRHRNVPLDLSRFDAAPLIAFTATKETNYGT
jgi:hypothetical protein